ncbi:MAG: HU family DNA-binding protein [Clostridia bacterium]|nr:HU family DNA-binding protein [Clostridia bacterium]MBQ8235848.1 HU family DNA-binding protein [Clostridia bacterium]MBQ8400279.1 HU family DNA-binding protein [Clostridia bacterium]
MTKKELISALAEKTGFTKKDAEAALNATLAAITEELAAGNEVQLTGFGTFSVKTRGPREGFNPKTGEPIQIGESKSLSFKAGKTLKDTIAK